MGQSRINDRRLNQTPATAAGPAPRRVKATCLSLLFLTIVRFAPAAAADWDGYASAASDYIYRGVSLLDSNPNLQAGVEGHIGDNFLVGTWGTNVDHQWLYTSHVSSHVELNFYTGADLSCGAECRARLIVTGYVFPGSATRDWQEATASVAFAERVGASFSWSPHGLGSWASARTIEAWYVQPVSRNTSLTIDVGNVSIRSFDYWYARAGISHRFDHWVIDLSRYISDPAFRRVGFDEHTQRFVLSISTAF